jgi:hypothetical protein
MNESDSPITSRKEKARSLLFFVIDEDNDGDGEDNDDDVWVIIRTSVLYSIYYTLKKQKRGKNKRSLRW